GLAAELLVDNRLGESPERRLCLLQAQREITNALDMGAEHRIDVGEVSPRSTDVVWEGGGVRRCEQRAFGNRSRPAFGAKDPLFRDDAAVSGNPARLSPRGEHAMTGNDEGKRVRRHRATDGPRSAGRSDDARQLTVRNRRAGGYALERAIDFHIE